MQVKYEGKLWAVGEWIIPRNLHIEDQTELVNSKPQSKEITDGTPIRGIQDRRRTLTKILCCSRLKRDCFWPSGWTINDREKVGETIGLRKRTNQVLTKVRKPPSWNWDIDELEITHDFESYSVGSWDKTEPRGLHPKLGTPKQNSGKPVSGRHVFLDEKLGWWNQTLLFS